MLGVHHDLTQPCERERDEEVQMNWRECISVDPTVCHGRVCVNATRVMVSVILDTLAAGESPEEIMRGYRVEREDI
jgi:uncharacterized protein (DUF433 family)